MTNHTNQNPILLWPEQSAAPNIPAKTEREIQVTAPWTYRIWHNIHPPRLDIFLPDPEIATGTGIIINPGGSYVLLAAEHEGTQVAEWLNQRGIAAFVLHYRLIETPEDEQLFWEYTASAASKEDIFRRMDPHAPVALEDALQAIRIVRGHAEEWGLKPDRIGMMGFSAGGHLAVNAALSQKPDCKLDFIAPIYGIWWHKLHIPKDAPSFFTACASNDPIAPESCVRLYQAWQAAERPAELHLYAAGDHGFGMVKQGLPVDGWIDRLYEWMVQQSLV